MKLVQLTAHVVDHPLRPERIIVSMAGRHDESRFLTIVAEDADGLRGYGEAATVALWSGETALTAKTMIDSLFGPHLLGATFDHPAEALAQLDQLAWGNPFVKGALDTALWDLWAKQKGVAAWQLFADRKPHASLPSRVSIGAYEVARTVFLAVEFWKMGICTLKFKVGVPGLDDAARLRAVREVLGDEPKFTVDYNGAFSSAEDAVRHIDSLIPFRIEYVEQPTHRDRIELMAEVRRRIPVPTLADESIFTPSQLLEAIDLDAFDILSLYPGKNGGFTHSLEMASLVQKQGKHCAIGTNLETDLGLASMSALAAGLEVFPVDRIASDFASSLSYQSSSITCPLRFAEGELSVPDGLGFGVTPRGL